VVAINHVVRRDDEWFDEPDELDRVARALAAIERIEDPVEAAAILAFRIARAQAFAEGNKRTALLVARWVLDRNGLEGAAFVPSDDQEIGALLVRAASGQDVGADFVTLLSARR
jgi:prophage maintenance system killer protein